MTDHSRASVDRMLVELRDIWAPLESMYPTTGYDECRDTLHLVVSMAANWGESRSWLRTPHWPHEEAHLEAMKSCVTWGMAYIRGTADEELDARNIAAALVQKTRRKYDADLAAMKAAKEDDE